MVKFVMQTRDHLVKAKVGDMMVLWLPVSQKIVWCLCLPAHQPKKIIIRPLDPDVPAHIAGDSYFGNQCSILITKQTVWYPEDASPAISVIIEQMKGNLV